ncbi:MAG: alpha/beta hydrolase [Blastomonas sp.]
MLALASRPALAAEAAGAHSEEILLWPGRAPGKGGVSGPEVIGSSGSGFGAMSNIATPRMRVYRPEQPNGRAIVTMGGGGYFRIQLWKESTPVSRWLQQGGTTVFELIYRLPNDGWEPVAPFMDAQRAMRIIRSRAGEFGIDPNQIGVLGFSAGGHLAGMAAVQPDAAYYSGSDGAESFSARPDFAALLFPVITMRRPFDTTRTKREIIGKEPDRKLVERWSVDTHVDGATPPVFMVQALDDPITPSDHCLAMFNAMRAKQRPVEMHFFEKGGHGFGLGESGELIAQWPGLFDTWVKSRTDSNQAASGNEE